MILPTGINESRGQQAPEQVPVPGLPSSAAVPADEAEKHLIQRVVPEYPLKPRLALQEEIVEVQATVLPDGSLAGIEFVSGDPRFRPPVLAALPHWRYKPFLKDGSPTATRILIRIPFSLDLSPETRERKSSFRRHFSAGFVAYFQKHDYQAAASEFLEALSAADGDPPIRSIEVWLVLSCLGNIAFASHKYDTAEHFYKSGLAVQEIIQRPDEAEVAESLSSLANVYLATNREDEAFSLLDRAVRTWEARLRDTKTPELVRAYSQSRASALRHLAGICRRRQQSAEARLLYEQALGAGHSYLAPDEWKALLKEYFSLLKAMRIPKEEIRAAEDRWKQGPARP